MSNVTYEEIARYSSLDGTPRYIGYNAGSGDYHCKIFANGKRVYPKDNNLKNEGIGIEFCSAKLRASSVHFVIEVMEPILPMDENEKRFEHIRRDLELFLEGKEREKKEKEKEKIKMRIESLLNEQIYPKVNFFQKSVIPIVRDFKVTSFPLCLLQEEHDVLLEQIKDIVNDNKESFTVKNLTFYEGKKAYIELY